LDTLPPAVQQAARYGNVEELRRLRVGEPSGVPVDSTASNGKTALHIAAQCDSMEAVQHLLSRGATVDLPDICKQTALHFAAFNNNAAVARELALHGADPHFTNIGGRTPLQYAEFRGHGAAIQAAIEVGQRDRAATQVRYCCCCSCLSPILSIIIVGAYHGHATLSLLSL
jgi:ankyrin repeat protein